MPKQTHWLNRRTAANIFHGYDFARSIGMAFNRYVTINLSASTRTDDGYQTFLKITHKYRDWFAGIHKRQGLKKCPPVYAYTLENANGMVHVNWAVYIPQALHAEFDHKLEMWVSRAKGSCQPFDIKNKPINMGAYKQYANYFNKGVDPSYVGHFFLQEFASDQGVIHGRRGSVSRAINETARKRANYKAKRDRNKRFSNYNRLLNQPRAA